MQPLAVQTKQNDEDQPESVSSCSNPEIPDAEDDQLNVFECPRTGLCLVGVCRTHGRFLLFEFDSNRDAFVIHKCPCQTQVYETDLYPKYCVRDPKSNDDVIFARNLVTCKIEQYVFNPKTCDFKQVFKPDLVYDASLKTVGTILDSDIHGDGSEKVAIQIGHDGSLVKAENRFGRTVAIAQFLVKTVMNVNEGEPSDDKVGMDNEEHSEILKLIPNFKIFNSAFSVHAFSTKNYEYKSYRFNYLTGDFYTVSLPNCPNPNRLCESQIQPKYAVYCDALKTFVLHAYNMENSYPEKFAFDKNTLGFFQVNEPELVYDPQNANTGSLVLFAHESLVVMEDYEFTLRKEQFCGEKRRFVKMAPMKIRTLTNQLKEKKEQGEAVDVISELQEAVEIDPAEEQKKRELLEHFTRLGLLTRKLPDVNDFTKQAVGGESREERIREIKQPEMMRGEMKLIFSKEEMDRFDCDHDFCNAWLTSTASHLLCSQPSDGAGSSSNVEFRRKNDVEEENDKTNASSYWNTIFPPV